MMNDDKLKAVPFSAQEDVLELDDQALEWVTGGGLFSGNAKGSASKPPTVPKSTKEPAGTVFTVETPGMAKWTMQANMSNYPDLKVVQQGDQYHLVSANRARQDSGPVSR